MSNSPIVTIEIPHQMPPVAWVAQDEEDFINKVRATYDNFRYSVWDMASFRESFGTESDDEYAYILDIIKEHGACIEVNTGGETYELSPAEAPTEFEAAKEYNGHDLSGCCTSDNLDDLRDYARAGHQSAAALAAIDQLAEDYHFMFED